MTEGVVFTLPHEYLPVWRYNEALFARILFKASQETLQQLLAQQPMDFITRLLQHVPPTGLHTIRYYGLYAPASKLRYQRCRQQCGTVEQMPSASSVDRLTRVIYCQTCGVPAQLRRRWWPGRSKGNSINREALKVRVSGSVQQVDEPHLAAVFYGAARTVISALNFMVHRC